MDRFRGAMAMACALILTACGAFGDSVDPTEAVTDSINAIDPAILALMPPGTTIESLTAGREGFVVCTVCHGLDGEGTALGPSLTDSIWIHIPADVDSIANLVRDGVANPSEFTIPMPVMGGADFNEEELRAVASYVYALSQNPH